MARFFVDADQMLGDMITLTGENAQHAKVLRLKAGEQVLTCDGEGMECLCEVIAMGSGTVELSVLERRQVTSEAAVSVSIYMGVPSRHRSFRLYQFWVS